MNPREYLGSEREVTQEWVPDPDNPSRDSEYPLGTERTLRQKLMDARDDLAVGGTSIHWDPPLANETYDNYPGQEIILPWWFWPSPNSCQVAQ